jgi:hypothetical protein
MNGPISRTAPTPSSASPPARPVICVSCIPPPRVCSRHSAAGRRSTHSLRQSQWRCCLLASSPSGRAHVAFLRGIDRPHRASAVPASLANMPLHPPWPARPGHGHENLWAQVGSNHRPLACKAGSASCSALPRVARDSADLRIHSPCVARHRPSSFTVGFVWLFAFAGPQPHSRRLRGRG